MCLFDLLGYCLSQENFKADVYLYFSVKLHLAALYCVCRLVSYNLGSLQQINFCSKN